MEFCNAGSVTDVMRKMAKPLTEQLCASIMKQVLWFHTFFLWLLLCCPLPFHSLVFPRLPSLAFPSLPCFPMPSFLICISSLPFPPFPFLFCSASLPVPFPSVLLLCFSTSRFTLLFPVNGRSELHSQRLYLSPRYQMRKHSAQLQRRSEACGFWCRGASEQLGFEPEHSGRLSLLVKKEKKTPKNFFKEKKINFKCENFSKWRKPLYFLSPSLLLSFEFWFAS